MPHTRWDQATTAEVSSKLHPRWDYGAHLTLGCVALKRVQRVQPVQLVQRVQLVQLVQRVQRVQRVTQMPTQMQHSSLCNLENTASGHLGTDLSRCARCMRAEPRGTLRMQCDAARQVS